jgi:hypothetical protein
MEKLNIKYSNKNIPIPTKTAYKLQLINKTESVIKRMRWKTLQFLGKLNNTGKETYGFRSHKCPPSIDELAEFEKDMMIMIKNVEFRELQNDFQDKLKSDIELIKSTKHIIVPADKSTNLYKFDKETYKKHLSNNITNTYKKANRNKVYEINLEAKEITETLSIDDRVQRMQESEAFITIKDHKEDFLHRPSFRLLNPSKTEIGKISKSLLDKINKNIVNTSKICQWKNTSSVIDWFNALDKKENLSFICFDIVNFYPSISSTLFKNSIDFAKTITPISDQDLSIIMQARKTVLFENDEPWLKKSGEQDFDVPMGCYDGAEVCELVGSFILNKLSRIININHIGLYRDDGLGVLKNISKSKMECMKKLIVKTFKDCGLSITIDTNMKSVNFLDVTLNLSKAIHTPYRKPNNNPLYININSNHPPIILKQLSKSIAKRISETSSSEEIFNEHITAYKESLSNSGFNEQLNYTIREDKTKPYKEEIRRKRNIIWYNPPYSRNIKTNIGRLFLSLISKHFPKSNKLHKIFNKNTIKISYSCMSNVHSIISAHNKSILHPKQKSFGCNCRVKENCPLNGECLTPKLIYKAEVSNNTNEEHKFYIGLAETPFKQRYANHTKAFKHSKYELDTELSKYVWRLKTCDITPIIKWSLIKTINSVPKRNNCKLCLSEKLLIINSLNDKNMLNKRSEFITKCRHLNKFVLKNMKRSDTMD